VSFLKFNAARTRCDDFVSRAFARLNPGNAMTDAITKSERRAANRAEFQVLSDTHKMLRPDQRELIKAEFARQRAASPMLSWARFLTVALPLLPADA
jgi:hypothetical protein